MVLSASLIDADEMNDFEMLWSDGLPGKEEEVWQKMSSLDFILSNGTDGYGTEEEKVGSEGGGFGSVDVLSTYCLGFFRCDHSLCN